MIQYKKTKTELDEQGGLRGNTKDGGDEGEERGGHVPCCGKGLKGWVWSTRGGEQATNNF